MMSFRQLALALALFVLPASAAAQDTGAPTSEPAASQPVGTIPSDFRLESGEEEQAEPGPVSPSIPAPTVTSTPNVQDGSARSQPFVTPPPAVVIPQAAPDLTPQPVPTASTSTDPTGSPGPASPQPIEETADQGGEIAPSLDVGPDPAPAAQAEQVEAGTNLWLPILGGLALAMFVAVALWRRRRQSAEEPEIERPEMAEAAPNPLPVEPERQTTPPPGRDIPPRPVSQPQLQPSEVPKLVSIGSLVSKKDVNPSTLVSTKPRSGGDISASASSQQAAPAPVEGGVTTNLAAKRKAEAEALQKARQDALKRRQAARPTVKRSVSFDWS